MTLDRRRFLQVSALGVISIVADSACAPAADRDSQAAARPQLLAILGPDRVRQIGSQYRSATPSENTAEGLRAALASSRGLRIPFIDNGSLNDQIRDDFASGRTVIVGGWVLSVTEARQAALFSLTPA